MTLGDRQVLLQVLYDNIRDKSKIVLGQKVVGVEHADDGVTVRCEDGSSYHGDVLAGADGVHSKTREILWELAGAADPKLVLEDMKCTFCHVEFRGMRKQMVGD